MRKHFSHTPGHNPLFISTSVALRLAELCHSYDKKMQDPRDIHMRSVPVLQNESLGSASITPVASDSGNNAERNDQGTLGNNPPDIAHTDCGVTEIVVDETNDLDIVVDGMEGLTAIEICEVQEFPLTSLQSGSTLSFFDHSNL